MVKKCGNCIHLPVCRPYTEPEETFPEVVGGCPAFEKKLIHCQECDYYDPSSIREYYGWCNMWNAAVRKTGYCHNGERRSNEL